MFADDIQGQLKY